MLKRKSTIKKEGKAAKKPKQPLSAEEVVSDDDAAVIDGPPTPPEDSGDSAAAAAAAAAAEVPKPKASTLAEGIKLLNAKRASQVTRRTRSSYADVKAKPQLTLKKNEAGDPWVQMDCKGSSVFPTPVKGKSQEIVYETPAVPLGFTELDPIRAVVQNNNPENQFKKPNPADVVATVNIDGDELATNPDYESSRDGMGLLYYLCSDLFCKASEAVIYKGQRVNKHRTAALAGDKKAAKDFTEAALEYANDTRAMPFLPCLASEAGSYGLLQDALDAGVSGKWKCKTMFFTKPGKDSESSGPHQPSIDLAKKLGGDNVDDLIAVIKSNPGRQLRLVPIYDEHNKLVPTEKYRETVAELRNGAAIINMSIRISGKALGGDERTAHVAAYLNEIYIVKREPSQAAAPTGSGIADFM